METDYRLNTLKKTNISSVRDSIWEVLYQKMQEKWYTQETFWAQLWKSHSYINQLIKWKTWTSSVYISLLKILWVSDKEIIEIYKKAFEKEKRIIFWEDIWIKNLSIEDNWQEPITTQEEAEKILFKVSWLKPTPEALRSVRLAIDMVRFEQEQQNKKNK